MPISLRKNALTSTILRAGVLLVGLLILLVSMARAGLEIWANDNNESVVSNNSISFTAKFESGDTAPGIYKIPESGMLSDNMFYGIKKVRDFLWINFSGGINKIKMAILQADKSVAEANKLIAKEKFDKVIESGNEAMDKLEYASKLLDEAKPINDQTKQLHYQIFWAGYAYKEVFGQIKDIFGVDPQKYTNLLNRINDWNKAQEENRYSWDI